MVAVVCCTMQLPNTLPVIPAPRSFVATGPEVDCSSLVLTEALVPSLAFVPQFGADEAYSLAWSAQGARLSALTVDGLRRGRATWAQLRASGRVPSGQIDDEPRFPWRGLMLDVSRHFYPVADVKVLLDRLASLKMNRFHWHLVDDQGWRLEIPGYPRFTEVGAWRTNADGSRYGGFYTAADVAEVLAYAADRGITVVPEIELPGHSMAALAAYPELSCTGEAEQVATEWGILDGVYCASSPRARAILEDVLAYVSSAFPGPWIHIGGDEVVRKRWEACPRCQAKIKEEGLEGVAGLEGEFFRKMIAFVQARGKTPVGWIELFEHTIPKNVPVQWWLQPERAVETLKAGNPLLSSNVEYCYFDYPYEDSDPWFQRSFQVLTPVSKVYANPVVPAGCDDRVDGILGGECCLWTERVPPADAVKRLRGRIEAFAEVYWSFDRRPGFDSFEARLNGLGLGPVTSPA
jgi:hexosaminidase